MKNTMANLLDYLNWRGDISLAIKPFNEVDGVILARLSYLRCDRIMLQGSLDHVPLPEAVRRLLDRSGTAAKPISENNIKMLTALLGAERYRDMELIYYMNRFDPKSQTQFAAVTVRIGPGRYFVAFRGTDNTLVGWKEDFNMSFVCPVPAQGEAVRYLDSLAAKLSAASADAGEGISPAPQVRFIVGGHSKGGNLAVYASAYCSEAVQQRIDEVYNFDGPGFTEPVLSSEGYKRICGRVRTYVPQSSIVGMLLGHEEKYTIVRSTNSSIWQHDTASWEVVVDHFRELESVTNSSRFVDYTLKSWMTSLEPQRRERFFDAVYTVLTETNCSTVRELMRNKMDTVRKVYRSVRSLDEEQRKDITYTMRLFLRSAKVGMLRLLEEKSEPKE